MSFGMARSLYVWLGISLLLGGVGCIVLLLLRYEPCHYRNAVIPEEKLQRLALEFMREFSEFWSAVSKREDGEWYGCFTDEQINSCFQVGQAGSLKLLPEGISEPRVVFEDQRMRLAFRYKSGLINTVISLSLRVWLTPAEPNVLMLQLERFDAGLVPFSAQWLLERISETARQRDIDVSWYRHDGHPVAIVRFQAD